MIADKSFNMVMGDRPIIFTRHALERIRQNHLFIEQVERDIRQSIIHPVKKDYASAKYKAEKDVYYFVNGKYTYTISKQTDKVYGKGEIALVITVTNYLYTLPT